jgi:membrane protein YqaA with SNARE-associated domain
MGVLRQWGGFGLFLVGIGDSFALPTFGSMDILLIVFCAGNKHLWPYYALASFAGSMVGGYVTYRVSRKGGKRALELKFGKQRLETVYKAFEKGGFGAVFVPVMLPPPFPTSPFLVAAGALNYPLRKFFVAMALGRAVRYTAMGAIGAYFGTHLVGFFQRHYQQLLIGFSALAILGGIGFGYFMWRKRKHVTHPHEKAA